MVKEGVAIAKAAIVLRNRVANLEERDSQDRGSLHGREEVKSQEVRRKA